MLILLSDSTSECSRLPFIYLIISKASMYFVLCATSFSFDWRVSSSDLMVFLSSSFSSSTINLSFSRVTLRLVASSLSRWAISISFRCFSSSVVSFVSSLELSSFNSLTSFCALPASALRRSLSKSPPKIHESPCSIKDYGITLASTFLLSLRWWLLGLVLRFWRLLFLGTLPTQPTQRFLPLTFFLRLYVSCF